MNRRELVTTIAGHTNLDKKNIDTALRGLADVVTASVAKGDSVSIPGFVKFARVSRKARMGRNPQTGEPVQIKAAKKARITPLKGMKDVVAGTTRAPKIAKPRATATPKASPRKTTAKR